MRKPTTLFLLLLTTAITRAQLSPGNEIRITVISDTRATLADATVALLSADSAVLKTVVTDSSGIAIFTDLLPELYIVRVTRITHQPFLSDVINLATNNRFAQTITLHPMTGLLQQVTITSKKPFVQHLADRTVVNVDASISNAGSTVMEVLEKSPGVTIDREGNISLKGRPGIQIMIDGKPTQLSGNDLLNLLSGMSSSQVDQIELIDNPSAKYDAAGNAGIINIRTKKNKQRGFNGSFSTALGQGQYTKNNNNLQLNFRQGLLNFFVSYGLNKSTGMLDLFALRTYYNPDHSIASMLEQPYFTKSPGTVHSIRTGVDYFVSPKTTVGVAFTGVYVHRNNIGWSTATWKSPNGVTDSAIYTNSINTSKLQQSGANINAHHSFSATSELAVDVDLIGVTVKTDQYFENRLATASIADANRGYIPSELNIATAKADYSKRLSHLVVETGWKSSYVNTDNLATYELLQSGAWTEDLNKSNHFLYKENIHALYANLQSTLGRWELQGGLRYEYTGYRAYQLGNAINKDSAFTRNYQSLFPSVFVSHHIDSSNSITFRTGRRIDRPPFQKLNPFSYVINKYTYQRGNPYILPQYTWNFEIAHVYREIITTTLSYNLTTDYFSQIFLTDKINNTIVYTDGNVGKLQNVGASVSVQLSPAKCWSLNGSIFFNHKKIEGVLWEALKTSINQGSMNINNQFRWGKGWGAELSGFYITRNQNDLQEVLHPTGQVSTGFSKQVLKTKGTVRLTVRDVFYSQDMEGLSRFETADEYFRLQRDTRVATISFSYRFGKSFKTPAKRNTGGAGDEIERAGGVN